MSLHPDRTLREPIKKLRSEQGLFQRDLAKIIGVDEMTIVNWEKVRARQKGKNLERTKTISEFRTWTSVKESHGF
jgi:DNA-binding XRE family transcriptional regulator